MIVDAESRVSEAWEMGSLYIGSCSGEPYWTAVKQLDLSLRGEREPLTLKSS